MDARFVEVGGVRLWTVTEGTAGPAVAVLHGGPGLPDYTRPLAGLLTPGCRVLRYDQRGSGRSDATPPWSLARFVADLDGLRAAWGVERWHVVGHSWGATLGLHYALAHPGRTTSLACLAGTGLDWQRWSPEHGREQRRRWTSAEAQRVDELRGRRRSPAEEVELVRLQLRTDSLDPDDHEAAIAELAGVLAAGTNRALNHQLNQEVDALDPRSIAERCATLAGVPVLVVDGVQDPRPAEAVDGLVAALPDVRRHTLDAGHELWFQRAAELRTLLTDHVARAESRASSAPAGS